MPDTAVRAETGYYVYAVVPADATVPGLVGLDDEPVDYVALDDLTAAVSRMALDRPPGRRAELLAHARVVDALAEAGAVVPVQFGSVLEDDESVVLELLEGDRDRYAELLERLGGMAQLNLRASYVSEQVLAEVVREDPVVAELRRRTRHLPEGAVHPDLVRLGEAVAGAMETKRRDDAAMLLDFVAPFADDQVVRPGRDLDQVVDLALLVARDRVDAAEEALEELAAELHERIRLRLVGPVAPYEFVGGASWG
jgi:hypothetical protein